MALEPLRSRIGFLRRLLAQDCILCAAASGDAPFCAGCAHDLPELADACPRCAGPSPGGAVCGACTDAIRRRFDATIAAWRYELPGRPPGAGAQVRRAPRARPSVRCRACRARRGPAGRPLVPMPLAPPRLRERGFNQAMEIARALARGTASPLEPHLVAPRARHAAADRPAARRARGERARRVRVRRARSPGFAGDDRRRHDHRCEPRGARRGR